MTFRVKTAYSFELSAIYGNYLHPLLHITANFESYGPSAHLVDASSTEREACSWIPQQCREKQNKKATYMNAKQDALNEMTPHGEMITISSNEAKSSTDEYLLLSVNSTCGQVNFGRPLSVPEDTELRQLYLAGDTY